MKTHLMISILALAATAGCKKKEASSDNPKSTEVTPAPKPADDGPFGEWDMTARKAAWQGAWSGTGDAIAVKAAWQVDGDKMTYVDSSGETHPELKLTSPCSASLIEKGADGSTSSTTENYTLQGGKLITGLGSAGSRKGDHAIACDSSTVFTFDGKSCLEWSEDFGKLKSKPGECGLRKDGGTDVFFYKANGHESVLLVDGDVIWSEQMKTSHATKQADLAAAKKLQGLP